jgi:integrase
MELQDSRMLRALERGESGIPKLVFPSDTGGPLDGSNVYNRDFLPCLKAAGLRRVTFHALRHTLASLLLQRGATLTYVKEQLGHSSIQITVDTYGHLIPGGNIDWVDRLDAPTTPQQNATQAQPVPRSTFDDSAQVVEFEGGPTRTRTWDQRIMSPLL